jgi:hypothetical protein
MIEKKTIDRKTMEGKHKLVKPDNIKHKGAREIGIGWLCTHTWNQLKLSELLLSFGWSI